MSISTSTLRTSLLQAALFTVTAASAAEISFNTNALTTSEVTTSGNWVGSAFPGTVDIATWLTDVDAVTAGNQESRGGILTVASPVSWQGIRHQDSFGPLTLTGAPITLGTSGITEVLYEPLTINNNIVLGAAQTWTNTAAVYATGSISGPFGLTKSGAGTTFLTGASTFTGPVSVGNGTLYTTSFNTGTAGGGGSTASSALGVPATVADGTIAVSSGNTAQATLGYLGAGETTDRVVRFPNGWGGIISNHGAGTLAFTSNMTGAAAGMGITITGGGVGVMNGITNTTALINFNKQGLGKWTVTGNLQPNGGNIRLQGGVLEFSATSSTTGDAIIGTANSGRTNSGVIRFAAGSSIKTAAVNTSGILGAWATFDNTTWAVTNGTGNAINGLATFTSDTWAAGNNTDVTVAGANPASGATTNSLRFNQAGVKNLALTGVNTVTSGGVIVTPAVGANATTISGGTLAGAYASDLIIHQHNTGGDLTISSIIANNPTTTPAAAATGLTKTGAGTLILSGANTYTGTTRVFEGKLVVNANNGAKVFEVSGAGTLEYGYSPGTSGYNGTGVTINGAGTASPNGLYLKGGTNYYFNSGVRLAGAPTTLHTYGTGNATLYGWDTNATHLIVENTASGSVIPSTILFTSGTYGYVMNVAPGLNTATGDVILAGTRAGSTEYRKTGTGSVRLTGSSSHTGRLDIQQGSVILADGENRLGTGSSVNLGNGSNSGVLILEGVDQTLTGATQTGTGTDNRIVGGSATTSVLTINNAAAATFAVTLGGDSANQNNIALAKSGVGVLTATGTRTHTGGTTISAGTLSLGSAGALGTTGVISLNGGTLQFTAANVTDYSSRIRLEDSKDSIIDTNGQNVSFASALQTGTNGDGGLNKVGTGTLTLGGSNTYTGPTIVTAGTLQLDYSISNTSKLADTSLLKLVGGSVNLVGGNHVEIVGDTDLTANTTITRTSGSSVLNLGTIYRVNDATLDLSAAGIVRTTLTNDVSGKLPGWITVAGQTASVDGSGNIVVYNGFVNVSRLGGKLPNSPNANVRIVNGGTSGNITALVSGQSTITSLEQGATDGPAVIDLAGSNTLRLGATGSILVPAASGALTIQQGTLTAGGGDGALGEIVVDADGALTIDAAIADNGLGNFVTLNKIGTGSLTLTQRNDHTGGTILNGGELRVNHNQALGYDGTLSLLSGNLDNTSGAAISIDDNVPQSWDGNFGFTGTNGLRFNNTTAAITLTGTRTVNVAASELSFAGTIAGAATFGITKTGAGVLTLDGPNTYTGVTTVNAGTLKVNANNNNNGKVYNLGADGTFEFGYGVGNTYGFGVTINGAGTAATTGLYLKGGLSYSLAESINLITAPTTVRTYGTGNAVLAGWDTNKVYMNVAAAASGSVFASTVDFHSSTYGYRMNIAAGANTATGDVTFLGRLTGPTNANNTRFQKEGAGSLVLAGQGTNAAPLLIQGGSVILSGGNDRIGTTAPVTIGTGTASAKLVLNGNSQTLSGLSTSGTGTTNAVVGGGATPSVLTVNYDGTTAQVFGGKLGGTGTNENNLSLVKGGTGSWSLASGSYTGNTTVNAGELVVTSAFFADGADVALATGATLKLETAAATDVIDQLIINGAIQPAGVYGPVGSGAQFERAYLTGTGKLSVTTGAGSDYNSWELANNISGAGAGTDSDGDGISNGIEFVIGGDPSGPNSASNTLLPTATTDANFINFEFRRTDESAPYNPYVQYSSTLANNSWTKAEGGVNGVTIGEDTDYYGTGIDRVRVKIPRTLAASGKLFARLRVDIP